MPNSPYPPPTLCWDLADRVEIGAEEQFCSPVLFPVVLKLFTSYRMGVGRAETKPALELV